jgi:hypothetical protein
MLLIGIGIGSLLTLKVCNGKISLPFTSGEQDTMSSDVDGDKDHSYNQEEPATSLDSYIEPPIEEITLPKVAIIIDDLGYVSPDLVVRLCNQNVAFNVAILPYQEFTKKSAEIANSKGKEVMLHLPMEPNGYPGYGKNPGPNAVMYNLSEREVRYRVQKAMAAVPFVKGVNNHMGSRITQDSSRMRWVLEEIRDKQCFFVDSRTEGNSVAFDVAVSLNVPSARREVFLDDDRDAAAITKQWERAMAIAHSKGRVVIIGHICSETICALENLISKEKGKVQFVNVSNFVN